MAGLGITVGAGRPGAAFVADVRVGGADAIRVELEHREGSALTVLLPYTPSRSNRPVKLGTMSAVGGEPRVWTSP